MAIEVQPSNALADAGFSNTNRVTEKSWASFQLSTYLLDSKLKSIDTKIAPFVLDPKNRDNASNELFKYAYQWY